MSDKTPEGIRFQITPEIFEEIMDKGKATLNIPYFDESTQNNSFYTKIITIKDIYLSREDVEKMAKDMGKNIDDLDI